MSLLVELTEPLFQYVCRLNRSARKGGRISPVVVRNDLQELFREMEQTAAPRPDLLAQYERVRLALVFFVDYMIKESELDFAREWEELARIEDEHAGDEKFFDLLDEALKEEGHDADERLLVYYQCLGLGFEGFYIGQPDELRRLMAKLSGRVRRYIDQDDKKLVCPDAYDHTDQTNLIEPPKRGLIGVGVIAVGLVVVVFVTNIALFQASRRTLSTQLDRLEKTDASAVAPADEERDGS